MERLTVKREDGRWALANNDGSSPMRQIEKLPVAIDHLAAYEETGMEPEDIDALQKRERGLAEMLVNVSCGCVVPYTRLAELAQAEKDGRLVILQPNDPLTLEELREMDGEPVWCEILIKSAKPSCYAIIHDGVATGFVKGKRINLGCDKIGGYGLAWVAYRRRPEEGEK